MSAQHFLFGLAGLLLTATAGLATEISGIVADEQGQALPGMSVRILHSPSEVCLGLAITDRDGRYSFDSTRRRPLLAGVEYTVEVIGDGAASLVFTPAQASVTIPVSQVADGDVNFTGAFDFSNFKQLLHLTGEDFPELVEFDLDDDYVFLKVYTVNSTNRSEQNLIFLGRVVSLDAVLVEVSIERTTTSLWYEIFGALHSADGMIDVGGQGLDESRLAACRAGTRVGARDLVRREYPR